MTENYEVFNNRGWTSTVYYLPGDPPRVCKAFNKAFGKDASENMFPVEKKAYERFAAHDHPESILKYYGVHESIAAGLVLELAENADVFSYLWNQRQSGHPRPDNETLYRWADQAAEALEFAHSLNVYNSDIHCVNFFLDRDLNLKVGDWAGASIDGSHSYASYRLRHRLFDGDGTDVARRAGITARTEIFALGTAVYYMVAEQNPWPELREPEDREEIKRRIIGKKFPDTSELPVLGDVIVRCWHVEFTSMTELRRAIEVERKTDRAMCPEKASESGADDEKHGATPTHASGI